MPTELPNERSFRDPGSMALDPAGEGIAVDETRRLIASNKVEGTAVYNRTGEQLGTVFNFMVDKVSGQVAYVVMSFGGFLGMGESYHPLPWKALTYDSAWKVMWSTSTRTDLQTRLAMAGKRTRSSMTSTEPRSMHIIAPPRARSVMRRIDPPYDLRSCRTIRNKPGGASSDLRALQNRGLDSFKGRVMDLREQGSCTSFRGLECYFGGSLTRVQTGPLRDGQFRSVHGAGVHELRDQRLKEVS